MSVDPHQPYQPQNAPAQPAVPAASKRSRLWIFLAAGASLLFVVIAVSVAITLAVQRGSDKPSAQPTQGTEPGQPLETLPDPTTAAPAPAATPSVSDIHLTPKITQKECFGSAGCLLTLKVKFAYDGPALSSDDTWLVTYDVNGVEDGPLVGSFEVTGDQYTVNEENVSTKSTKSKVTIKATSVEKVGS
jgi:hypothetical protein